MTKTQIAFGISGFIILSILIFFSLRTVKNSKEKLLFEAKAILNTVAHIDAEKRFYECATFYLYKAADKDAEPSSTVTIQSESGTITYEKTKEMDELSPEEKTYIFYQHYLSIENPIKVQSLDSLFNRTLRESYSIPFETAIIYTAKDSSQYSADSAFYTSASALLPIYVDSGPIKILSLEGFIKIPLLYWLTQLKDIILLSIIIYSLYIYIGRKYVYKASILPLQVSPRTLQKICDSLYFDEDKGYLFYKNSTIALKDIQLRLFTLLLNSPEHFRTYEDIKISIWNNIDTPQNTVNKTILRLRESLSTIPIIKLENIRGKGCELTIND